VYESDQILEWLSQVPDPEIPVLTITDLGIVRGVDCSDGVTVSLTPTYSGCPATEAIEASVVAALEDRGVSDVRIKRVLSPAWTTDWIARAPGSACRLSALRLVEHGSRQ
jgi:ring-1,2-phenylacetyl-CoA epoxidase subunit PaaD